MAVAASGAQAIVNFAAETHVDRSIAQPDAFVKTHALGTYVLLEAAREHSLRYVQVSTDEVYGSIEEGTFTEQSPLAPSSPYSATKAGADLLVQSYHHTYGLRRGDLPRLEQLRPLPVPREADPADDPQRHPRRPAAGLRRRHAGPQLDPQQRLRGRAIGFVLEHGRSGEVYNAGGPDEEANIEVVRRIIELTGAAESQIEHITDRPGHDRRYSLSSEKVRALGWEARVRFAEGLEQTVGWYRENAWWWEPIRSGDYRAYYERQYGRGPRPLRPSSRRLP